MDDKPKNFKNDAPRINNILFLILWVAGHAAAWLLALIVNRTLTWMGIYIQSELVLGMLMALGTGIPSAIVQLVLVERGLKRSMRWWLPVSVVGWALSGLAFYLLWSNLPYLYQMLVPNNIYLIFPRIMFLPLFVPVALVQWAYLRRKVKSAGLWVIAALTGALLFAVPNGSVISGSFEYVNIMGYVMAALAALLYSGATGATMLYLWTQQRNSEKSKNLIAAAEAEAENDAERLQRLNDAGDESSVQPDLSQPQKAVRLNR